MDIDERDALDDFLNKQISEMPITINEELKYKHQKFNHRNDFEEITPDNDVYVSAINHSAKITNNTNGTKAAAATVIIVEDECVDIMPDDAVEITLDRPFVYFINDTEACIPLFVGAFNNK